MGRDVELIRDPGTGHSAWVRTIVSVPKSAISVIYRLYKYHHSPDSGGRPHRESKLITSIEPQKKLHSWMDYREAITISDLIHPLLRCAPQAPVGSGSSSGTTSVHHEEYLKLPYSQCTHSSMGWFSNGSWPLLAGQCVVIKAI